MKTRFILFSLLSLLIIATGCKKDKNSDTPTQSTWTLEGKTYTANSTKWYQGGSGYSFGNELTAKVNGDLGAIAIIVFKNRPNSSGSYSVQEKFDGLKSHQELSDNEVFIAFYDNNDILSIGEEGTVKVFIKSNKMHVTFSNIKTYMSTVSGTLVEQ